MFRKVIVPLDGSSLAEQALGLAAAIARAENAEIDLVMVYQPLPLTGLEDTPWMNHRWNHDEGYLEAIGAELSSGASVPTTHAILEGDPADMICRRIRQTGSKLVVMTTHGRTGLSRAWLGSTADRVLRHSSVPVLMLRPIVGKARETAAHHLFKRILVALDGSAMADDILPAAEALARCGDARLMLLHVVQPVPLMVAEPMAPGVFFTAAYPPVIPDDAATERLRQEATEQLAERARALRDRGIECDAHVVVADRVAQRILDEAKAHAADAIAMATRGRGASRLFVGSVADKVLRASGLPTLLLRPVAADEESHSPAAAEPSAASAHT